MVSINQHLIVFYAIFFPLILIFCYRQQVLEVARVVTKEVNDNDTAKEKFIQRMNHSDMYFIQEEIPKNESDENAHVVCGDIEGAKTYCPTRWKALQNWFKEAQKVSVTK